MNLALIPSTRQEKRDLNTNEYGGREIGSSSTWRNNRTLKVRKSLELPTEMGDRGRLYNMCGKKKKKELSA